jgi:hypothetical protein
MNTRGPSAASRRRLGRSAVLAVAAALAALGAGCRDASEPPPGGAPVPDAPAVEPVSGGTFTPPPAPPPLELTPEEVESRRQAWERDQTAWDVEARRLLEAFEARVWEPARDGPVVRAGGEVALDLDGRKGRYRFTFDGSKKDDEQVAMTTVEEEAGIHQGAAAQAKRWAIFALRGPWPQVVGVLPPLRFQLLGGGDGPAGKVVVIPPFQTKVGTSFKLDARGLVVARGDSDGRVQETSRNTWFAWRERAVLTRMEWDGGKAVQEFEYADRGGVPALRRAVLTEGGHRCEGTISYTEWARE